MNEQNLQYEKIPPEKFAFVNEDKKLHDKEIQTKARSYLADALLRFSKNKSSVVAAWILLFLILFAVIAPMVSPYTVNDKDKVYVNMPAFIPWFAENDSTWFAGSKSMSSQNDAAMNFWKAIGMETGMDPLIEVTASHETEVKMRGKMVKRYTYDINVNSYYAVGIVYRTFSYEEYAKIQQWQKDNNIQIIYPYVDSEDIGGITNNPNIWYEVDASGNAKLDKEGNFVPVYSKRENNLGAPYDSLRIPGDDGSFAYSLGKSGAVQCRVCYYNYYQYLFGHKPIFIFGTTAMGMDLFSAIGVGARFSLVFALLVSVINLFIGTIYGSIQGYYGGAIDMTLDRITDILSGVPFVVVTTLFQLHLAQKVGVVPSFLFAFVLTGWIGMASLTRTQFYRFKGQEFVMAARTLGASDKRLMFKHIFPNAIGTIITSCALIIPGVIGSETSMTYLGIVDLSSFTGSTIGTLLSQGNSSATTAPHAMLWPSIFIGLLMICFNLFGNGLRDAFNPTTRGQE